MKKMIASAFAVVLAAGLSVSCVSIQDRPLVRTSGPELEVVGSVQTQFTSVQFLHIQNKQKLRERAYRALLENARRQYGSDVDVRNIRINGSFSSFNLLNMGAAVMIAVPVGSTIAYSGHDTYDTYRYDGHGNGYYPSDRRVMAGVAGGLAIGALLSGNTQAVTATGDVVSVRRNAPQPPDTRNERRPENRGGNRRGADETGMEGAINRAAGTLIRDIPANLTVALVNVSSSERETSTFAMEELQFRLVGAQKFRMIDKDAFDLARSRRGFQRFDDMSDAAAVAVGQTVGANVVIVGSITRAGLTQTLTVKALETRTGEILTMVRESF